MTELHLELRPAADVALLRPIAERLADDLDVDLEDVADAIAEAYVAGCAWGVAEVSAQLVEAGVEAHVHVER